MEDLDDARVEAGGEASLADVTSPRTDSAKTLYGASSGSVETTRADNAKKRAQLKVQISVLDSRLGNNLWSMLKHPA